MRFATKFATAGGLKALPSIGDRGPVVFHPLEPDEVGQRLRDLVHEAHRAALVLLELVDEVDLALDAGFLRLVVLHFLEDGLEARDFDLGDPDLLFLGLDLRNGGPSNARCR